LARPAANEKDMGMLEAGKHLFPPKGSADKAASMMRRCVSVLLVLALQLPYVESAGCLIPPDANGHVNFNDSGVPDYAFESCASLRSITLVSNVTRIGTGAFYGCSSLTSITISSGLTTIGAAAFYGCASLTSITLPSSLTSIGSSAFYSCTSLRNVTISSSSGLTSLDSGTFQGCTALTSITLPWGLATIGASSFQGCSALTSVTLPSSVRTIGNNAFSSCGGITSLTSPGAPAVPGALTLPDGDLGMNLGMNLGTLILPDGLVTIGSSSFQACNALTSVTLPSSVRSIGSSAFMQCPALHTVTLPVSLASVGQQAFAFCTSLTSIDASAARIIEIPNFFCAYCSQLSTFLWPAVILSIGNNAFRGTALTTVSLRERTSLLTSLMTRL